MNERVVENEWREQAFDERVAEPASPMLGLDALAREIESLGSDMGILADLISVRTERVQALRSQVADIARTLP